MSGGDDVSPPGRRGEPYDGDGSDEIARLLARLRSVEPVSGSVDDAIVGVRHRVARRAARVRGAAAAVALGAAVALVVIPSLTVGTGPRTGLLTGASSPMPVWASPGSTAGSPAPSAHPSTTPGVRGGGHSPTPPGVPTIAVIAAPAYDVLGCPTVWVAPTAGAWVPAAGPASSLIATDPVRLLVCGYPGASGPRSLAGDVSVHQGFAAMTGVLAGSTEGRLDHCRSRRAATDFLVRADYADGSTSWVSAGSCAGATNGAFTTSLDLAPRLAGVLAEQGSWGGPYPGDCSTTTARPGVDEAMVPGGTDDAPLLGYLCVTNPGSGQQPETVLTGSTLTDLVTDVDGLTAAPGAASCPDSGGTTYLLVLVYAGGENVSVTVEPGCDSGVSNGVLVAAPTDTLVHTLDELSTPSPG